MQDERMPIRSSSTVFRKRQLGTVAALLLVAGIGCIVVGGGLAALDAPQCNPSHYRVPSCWGAFFFLIPGWLALLAGLAIGLVRLAAYLRSRFRK